MLHELVDCESGTVLERRDMTRLDAITHNLYADAGSPRWLPVVEATDE